MVVVFCICNHHVVLPGQAAAYFIRGNWSWGTGNMVWLPGFSPVLFLGAGVPWHELGWMLVWDAVRYMEWAYGILPNLTALLFLYKEGTLWRIQDRKDKGMSQGPYRG